MSIPASARQVVIKELGNKYREITEVQTAPVPKPEAGKVLIKNKFVGINASEINYSSGGYDPNHKAPMVGGLEGIGEVVAVGEGVDLKVGQAVVFLEFGSFAEYLQVEAKKLTPVPTADPALLCIVLSGLTASISLEKEADLKKGKTVFITAAAGGTGQFAVQIAKQAGCHVIGTCSSPEKSKFLKSIGCDRVINYRTENVGEVLAKEYPSGVDVVYECVGKEMFDTAVKNLALHGRLIVIGSISTYERENPKDQSEMVSKLPISLHLLRKSASIRGFLLLHYAKDYPRHIAKLANEYAEGKIKITIDKGERSPSGPFKGLEKTIDAVEYMYSGKNIGKIIVEL